MDRWQKLEPIFQLWPEPVLNDIKLSVDRGDFIVFIGPNGSERAPC